MTPNARRGAVAAAAVALLGGALWVLGRTPQPVAPRAEAPAATQPQTRPQPNAAPPARPDTASPAPEVAPVEAPREPPPGAPALPPGTRSAPGAAPDAGTPRPGPAPADALAAQLRATTPADRELLARVERLTGAAPPPELQALLALSRQGASDAQLRHHIDTALSANLAVRMAALRWLGSRSSSASPQPTPTLPPTLGTDSTRRRVTAPKQVR